MTILYIIILILAITIFVLSLVLFQYIKKSIHISDKEKEFIIFVMDIFTQYGDELGIQSKEQHAKLCEELEKIKKKHLTI